LTKEKEETTRKNKGTTTDKKKYRKRDATGQNRNNTMKKVEGKKIEK